MSGARQMEQEKIQTFKREEDFRRECQLFDKESLRAVPKKKNNKKMRDSL